MDNRSKLLALLAPKVNYRFFFGNAIENGQKAPNVNPLTSLQKIGQQIKTFGTFERSLFYEMQLKMDKGLLK